jgi:DNA polymerase III delta subunit
MSFQTFLNEIEKGLPSLGYLFHASDTFLNREAISAVKKLIPEEEREFNFHIFDFSRETDEKTAFEQIFDVADTVPFFGKRKFVVFLGNLQGLSKKDLKRLDSYISNPAPYSVLVIFHEGVLKKEMRERFKCLKIISLDIREAEIPSWIRHRAKLKGLEISDDVADYLLGLKGPDLGLLSAEIEKISLLGKQKVSVDDISEIIEGGGFYTPFDLVQAIEGKNTEKVFRIYKALRETTENYSLIGILNWLYGRKLPARNRQKGNEYLLKVFEALNTADIDIKSSGRNFPMEYLLVRLLRL